MKRRAIAAALTMVALTWFQPEARGQQAATLLLDRAIERMGGESDLRAVHRVRFDIITQWLHTSFDDAPWVDMPGYEVNTDIRDYDVGGWRNTRHVSFGNAWHDLVDVVRDSVAARDMGSGLQPLSVAYVDERDELFAYTPDRLVLGMKDARDLRPLPDTTLHGRRFARVSAQVGTLPMTLLLRREDGLPAGVLFHAAAPNDFGLVPWGDMKVEVWYSNWITLPGGISLPREWDVRRVGRPYKRITLETVAINPAFAADSFFISRDVRAGFFATQDRPMHDLPLDSARVIAGSFIEFRTPGAPAGAVRLGDQWVLLEGGQAPLSADRALAWMEARSAGKPVLAIMGAVRPANGGAGALARSGVPLLAGPGAAPFLQRVLRNHGSPAPVDVVTTGRWIEVGSDSLRVEPVELPNTSGALLVWSPSLAWVWAPDATTPLALTMVRERVRELGWAPRWLGTSQTLRIPYEGG